MITLKTPLPFGQRPVPPSSPSQTLVNNLSDGQNTAQLPASLADAFFWQPATMQPLPPPLRLTPPNPASIDNRPLISRFEEGSVAGFSALEVASPQSAVFVQPPIPNPAAGRPEAGPVVRFQIKRSDPYVRSSHRAELADHPRPMGELIYRFGIMLPADYRVDASPEIIAQWHNTPDIHRGERYNLSPSLALQTKNGHFILASRYDRAAFTPDNQTGPMGAILADVDLGPYQTSVWNNFELRARWSSQPEKGYYALHRNGQKLHEFFGPNAYNDVIGPYFKVGLYKWEWKNSPEKSSSDQRTLYVSHMQAIPLDATRAQLPLLPPESVSEGSNIAGNATGLAGSTHGSAIN